jgi:hypothetical protein
MSEIPFVNRLGDALETAITMERAPRRRWVPARRRLLVIAVAIAVAAGATLAVARILSSPTKLATISISCFDGNLAHGEFYVDAGDRTPIEACAHALRSAGHHVPALVACDNNHGEVTVFPGSGADACRRAGFTPLPRGYSAAHARVRALSHAIRSIEASSDCIPLHRMAARVQALLRRSGWDGWRVWLRDDFPGPCGAVSGLQGDGSRSIAGSLDYDGRRVMVFGAAHRSTETLVWGRHGVSASLSRMSLRRCYTPGALRRAVRRRLARTHRHVAFTSTVYKPQPNMEIDPADRARLDAGCTIARTAYPAADGLGIVVELEHEG